MRLQNLIQKLAHEKGGEWIDSVGRGISSATKRLVKKPPLKGGSLVERGKRLLGELRESGKAGYKGYARNQARDAKELALTKRLGPRHMVLDEW